MTKLSEKAANFLKQSDEAARMHRESIQKLRAEGFEVHEYSTGCAEIIVDMDTEKRFCEYKGPKCEVIADHWNSYHKKEFTGWFCQKCYAEIRKKQMGNNWKRVKHEYE